MALTGHRASLDPAGLEAALARVEAAMEATDRSAVAVAARREAERWAFTIPDGAAAGIFGSTGGMRRLELRMAALPAILDAIAGITARGVAADEDVATLTAAWDELEAPGEGLDDGEELEGVEGVHPEGEIGPE